MEAEWVRERLERRLKKELGNAAFSEAQRETLRKLNESWVVEGFSLQTRIGSIARSRKLARFLKKPFEEATRDDLNAFLNEVAASVSAVTFETTKRFVKSFYRDLLCPDGGPHPAVVSWIRLTNPLKSYKLPTDMLTSDEVRRLVAAASHPRDRAIIMVLYESTARVTELVSLKVKDVEFDQYGARLTLTGKTGMRKVRLIDSVPALAEWLNHHPLKEDREQPLFLSWGHQNQYKPLMGNGVADLLRRTTKLAGVNKRVHPHLFRHTRLTELAKQLSDSELKIVGGWTANSPMARVYIHLSGEDVDRKMLEKAGVVVNQSGPRARPMAPKPCPRCATPNDTSTTYCVKCTLPLEARELRQALNDFDWIRDKLPALMHLLDRDTEKLLKRKLMQRRRSGHVSGWNGRDHGSHDRKLGKGSSGARGQERDRQNLRAGDEGR